MRPAAPAEAGLRSALVNTFHELGGAAGVAALANCSFAVGRPRTWTCRTGRST